MAIAMLSAAFEPREGLVPPKIRELIADLQAAGFADRGGKGSHRNFVHLKVDRSQYQEHWAMTQSATKSAQCSWRLRSRRNEG
jgi:hypothetical protein